MALKFDKRKLMKFNPNAVKYIVMHHVCGKGLTIEDIHRIHLNNGWAGCGYHYYVRFDGHVFVGRPIEYIGSHCLGKNSISVGIALEGDFRKDKPTDAQIKSVKELIPHIREIYPKITHVMNHRDLYPTLCPVVDLKDMVTDGKHGRLE